ncbi:MAG TPA: hypothetical protein VIB48_07655 [Acidimicrobiia bacterium]|jgi:predicted AlkP superfamily phosphohydrolase/phosphomutase
MTRVLAIGLDSATGHVLDDLARRGELTNLARLRADAARYQLRSGHGHRHGMLWPQFIAGTPARFDGAWLRLTFDPDTYEPYQESARYMLEGVEPFWDRAGVETVSFDVPRTACGGSGVQVTAWGGHAPLYPRASNPPGLLAELDTRFGVHPAYGNDYGCGWHDPARLDRLTDALVVGASRRADIATHLEDRYPWELFLTTMSETHSLSEFTWHGVDDAHPLAPEWGAHAAAQLRRMHRAVDAAVGRIVAAAPPDTAVLLFSLDAIKTSHGDLPSIVLLPELLHRQAFGRPLVRDPDQDAWRAAGYPPVLPRRGRPWRPDLDERLVNPPVEGGVRGAIKRIPGYETLRMTKPGRMVLDRLRHTTHGALGLPIPAEYRGDYGDAETERESTAMMLFLGHYRPYWSKMPAFVLPSFGDGYVRINLQGRERDGVVAPDDYRAACDAVEQTVRECVNPRTGSTVALEVERVEGDPFDNPGARYADLVIRWREPIDAFRHPDVGTIGPFPLHRTGTHEDGGFLWMSGSGVAPGDEGERSVLDIPPTILALLGRRAPDGLAGRALVPTGGVPQPA